MSRAPAGQKYLDVHIGHAYTMAAKCVETIHGTNNLGTDEWLRRVEAMVPKILESQDRMKLKLNSEGENNV